MINEGGFSFKKAGPATAVRGFAFHKKKKVVKSVKPNEEPKVTAPVPEPKQPKEVEEEAIKTQNNKEEEDHKMEVEVKKEQIEDERKEEEVISNEEIKKEEEEEVISNEEEKKEENKKEEKKSFIQEEMEELEEAERDQGEEEVEETDEEIAKRRAEQMNQLMLLQKHQEELFKEVKFDGHGAAPKEVEAAVVEDHVDQDLIMSDKTFESFGLSHWMVDTLKKRMKITTATKIQKAAIPVLMGGRDAFIKAETGSGKTLSYAIPLVHSLGSMDPPVSRQDGLRAIIVAPTRELCQQIHDVVQVLLTTFISIVPGVIVGGQKKASEKARLRKGINVVVATPGRLVDHIKTSLNFKLARVDWLVLDEADRLLDMGFQKDLSFIVCALDRAAGDAKDRRRNVLVSATLNRQVQQLAYFSLRNPEYVDPGGVEAPEAMAKKEYDLPPGLQQGYALVEMKERLSTLAAFLRAKCLEGCRVLVFFSSIDAIEFHYALFTKARLQYLYDKTRPAAPRPDLPLIPAPIYKLHGDLSQLERSSVYAKFRASSSGVIFCTDVAARGIDLPNVNWIVQYDPPGEVADYIHRVGRTARIGHTGNAFLFLLPAEEGYVDLLHKRNVPVRPTHIIPILKALAPSGTPKTKLAELAHFHQIHFEHLVLDDPVLAELGRKGFVSFVRAYSTHSHETSKIFVMKDLHLGHVAKSFALREAPTILKRNLTSGAGSKSRQRREDELAAASDMRRGKGAGFKKGFNRVGTSMDEPVVPYKRAQDTRNTDIEKLKRQKDQVRTPISAYQGKKRAMAVVVSEFSDGAPSTKKPKK